MAGGAVPKTGMSEGGRGIVQNGEGPPQGVQALTLLVGPEGGHPFHLEAQASSLYHPAPSESSMTQWPLFLSQVW